MASRAMVFWAAAVVAVICLPLATAQAPSNLSNLFSNDGPTFIFTNTEWTLYMPLVDAKNSGKVGVINVGNLTYTFLAPRNKVPKTRKDGSYNALTVRLSKVALTAANVSAAKTQPGPTISLNARIAAKGTSINLSNTAATLNGSLPQQILFGASTSALTGTSGLKFSVKPRLQNGKSKTMLSTTGYTYYALTDSAGKVAVACKDGYGGGKGASACTLCAASTYGKQLSIAKACPLCSSVGPAAYSASTGVSACSICPSPQAATPSGKACGSSAKMTISTIAASPDGCSQRLINVTKQAYVSYLTQQSSVVPASIAADVKCSPLARRRQLFRLLQQSTTRVLLEATVVFQSSSPQDTAEKALAIVDTLLTTAYTAAGIVVTVISSTGTIVVTTSDGSSDGGSRPPPPTPFTCPAAGAQNYPCNNFGGVCVASGGNFVCICKDGYSAALCSTCASGYVAVEGSGKDVRCVKQSSVTCGGLPASVTNGTFPASCNNAVVGTTCTATCNAGFTGSPTATCSTNGAWSAVTGSCTRAASISAGGSCILFELPAVANGVWPATCEDALEGETCIGICNEGYSGAPTATCGIAGTWSGVNGGCKTV